MTDTPTTPERAGQIGNRWRLAAVVIVLTPVTLSFVGIRDFLLPGLIAGALCWQEASSQYGWRSGYLARERDEKRQEEVA